MEITIDKLKGIALHIKIEAANDLGLKDERFKGIVEGLDKAINHLERVAGERCFEVEIQDNKEMVMTWLNYYECPECNDTWQDEWDCQVDNDCPSCGCRHISPYESVDI